MKKVFLFGRFVRIAFVLSLSFFIYAFVDMTNTIEGHLNELFDWLIFWD